VRRANREKRVVEAGTLAAMADPRGLRGARSVERRGVVGEWWCGRAAGIAQPKQQAWKRSCSTSVVMRRESGPVALRAKQDTPNRRSFAINSGDNTPKKRIQARKKVSGRRRCSARSTRNVELLSWPRGEMGDGREMQEMQVSW